MPSTQPLPKHHRDLPKLSGTLIGGNLKEFIDDALLTIERAHREHGDLVRVRMGTIPYLLVNHPDAVHHILTTNASNYRKDTKGYRTMKKLLGEGLLTANGERWLVQRRTAQPGFHRDRIQSFAQTMVRCTEEMLDDWRGDIAEGARIDVNKELMSLTLRVIGLTMMSVDFQQEARELGDALTIALTRTDELITSLPGADLWPTQKNRAFHAAVQKLDDAVARATQDRVARIEAKEEIPGDLLTMLLEAKDPETGRSMSAGQLRDEMMTIFLAGHETTANALTWSFYLLAQNEGARLKLEAELDAGPQGTLQLADLDQLPYTKQVIQEALRLYPPAWIIGRNSVDDDELLGVTIPGGTNHFISPLLLGRHKDFWERPDAFEPERFAGDPKLRKGLYIPFIEGPRQCIGKAFAMMEAQLILATLAREVRLDLAPGQEVKREALITLRPEGGLPMTLSSRKRRRSAA